MRFKIVLKSFLFTLILAAIPVLAMSPGQASSSGESGPAPICGGYQSEDYGDRVIYTLTDFRTPLRPTYYSIQNPGVELSLSLLRGACYCVKGDVKSDFEFNGDTSYKIIQLNSIVGTPTFDCWPNP